MNNDRLPNGNAIPSDKIWLKENPTNAEDLWCWSTIDNDKICRNVATIKFSFSPEIELFFKEIISPQNQNYLIDLSNSSQLALVDYWWQPYNTPCHNKHSRLMHSIGVLRVADAWRCFLIDRQNEQLEEDVNLEKKFSTAIDTQEKIFQLAALLHDLGHSPFSHLIEKVFSELNWSLEPGGSKFSHEQLTKVRVHALVSKLTPCDSDIECSEIFHLLDGVSGKAWMDAIINSPIDADKIDYIFRDQDSLKLPGRQGTPQEWLGNFLAGQCVSSTGQIFLNGTSAEAAFKLLSERCYMYDKLYYSPKIQVMECMLQNVLTTFFTLYVSNMVMSGINKILRNNPKLAVREIAEELTKDGMLLAGQKDSIETNLGYVTNYLEKIHGIKPEKALNNFGMIKIIFALACIERLIEKPFQSQRINTIPKERKKIKLNIEEELNQIDYPHNIKEFDIVKEIGFWAGQRRQSCVTCNNKTACDVNVDKSCKDYSLKKAYADLESLCIRLLAPQKVCNTPSENRAFDAGRWMDAFNKRFCLAGPYIIRLVAGKFDNVHEAEDWLDKQKSLLVDIGRQLSREYPGRVLVGVTGPLKVRTYPDRRKLRDKNNHPIISEQFWVPKGDPQTWNANSKAEIPLSLVDFRASIPQAYKLQVFLVDLSGERDKGGSVIIDRFRNVCSVKGIKLEEN